MRATDPIVRQMREDSAAAIKRWRERGGYEGALKLYYGDGSPDLNVRYGKAPSGAIAATGHMPFPHKHCGEWR